MDEKVTTKSAPYAPVAHVLTVIRRRRERGMLFPITLQTLGTLGVPDGNQARTLVALRFLGLIDPEGHSTEGFDRLWDAKSEDYQDTLAEIVRAAYEPVFTIVNPAEDSDIAISDAFRQYQPENQRNRMVVLFRGLCEEAGIVNRPARRASPPPSRPAQRPKKGPIAPEPPAPVPVDSHTPYNGSALFTLTTEDVSLLDKEDFDLVWGALGKIAWAKGQAQVRKGASVSATLVLPSPED